MAAVLLGLAAGPLWAGTEGAASTFYGQFAGASGSGSSGENTFIGVFAGNSTTGIYNTFLGNGAGQSVTTGYDNFLGFAAGYSEAGSNKLYIATRCALDPLAGDAEHHTRPHRRLRPLAQ
jgi:hypothetical protein